MIVQEIRNCVFYGIKDYLNSWSNILTCIMTILYPVAFALKFYTNIVVSLEKKKLHDENFWQMIEHLDEHDIETQKSVYQTFYWLNTGNTKILRILFFKLGFCSHLVYLIDRFYWYSLDPINLSEGLFAFGIIISFSRLCFWLPSNQNLGPLQITLGRMITVYFVV